MIVETVIAAPEWDDALPSCPISPRPRRTRRSPPAGRDPSAWTLCLLACDDARIAALNGAFRGRARATNVLSWPAHSTLPADSPGAPRHLGDIALALETVRGEAAAASLPLKDHAMHLILHGCLHLLGHDHDTDTEATVMEGIESRVLTGMGLADPYRREGAQSAHSDG